MNPNTKTLAKNLLSHSVALKKGEKILIDARGAGSEALVCVLIEEAYAIGGLPFVWQSNHTIMRQLLLNADEESLKTKIDLDAQLMEQMDAYVGIITQDNIFETSDVPIENMKLYNTIYRKVLNIRLTKKWVGLRFPTPAMAQSARKSLTAFEEFYYNVCNLDYKKMDLAMEPLKKLMEATDKVHLTSQGTDLSFSIKGIPVIKCSGELNIPDGEIFTAPVKDSVNGYITFNTPSLKDGFLYENVRLEFENGKIVNATANDTDRINKVLDIDEGARYIGEFALGVNPYIEAPMNDTLFDEKISGSIHFTPGDSYDEASNGNKSTLHWDLISIQTPEYGGGEIYFDGVLVRKDGRFVLPELEALNPENLK